MAQANIFPPIRDCLFGSDPHILVGLKRLAEYLTNSNHERKDSNI